MTTQFPVPRIRALLLSATILLSASVAAAERPSAYVDPALRERNGQVSALVTADTSEAAAAAVRRCRGTVTSDLPIVNAVAARIPARCVPKLARSPRILSVIENKRVGPAAWKGWVSDLRVVRGRFSLATAGDVSGVHLPDGGFAAISTKGVLVIVNADGSQRKQVTVSGTYGQQPVLTSSGSLAVVSEGGLVSLLDPRGALLRQVQLPSAPSARVRGNLVSAGPMLYVVDSARTAFAIDSSSGVLTWKRPAGTSGRVVATPVAASDRTLYFATDSGDVHAVRANGDLLWSSSIGAFALSLPPQIHGGSLYLVAPGTTNVWALDANSGKLRFRYNTGGAIQVNPLVTGELYVAAADGIHALNVQGTRRFFAQIASPTRPAVSSDGATLHVTNATGAIAAIDVARGSARWSRSLVASALGAPVADPDGTWWVAAKNVLYQLNAAGSQVARYDIKTAITQVSEASSSGAMIVQLGMKSIAVFGRLPEQWNGKPDVARTDEAEVFRLANPVAVDVGADVLHQTTLSGGAKVRGDNVTVAVIDSGVYFDDESRSVLAAELLDEFLGQADFVEKACAKRVDGRTAGKQNADHCFTNAFDSRDGYGHGVHVSGSITSILRDEATNSFLGVAPEANLLSIRVLGDDGTGTYESVIQGIQYAIKMRSEYGVRVMNLSLSAYATVPYFVDPLNRAVEQAWKAGIVVVAAAGNTGPFAQTITVPGNDPYVITVGALSSNRTPGYWSDDVVAGWSATGPTFDGFAKPDVLAPGSQIVSYLHNDPTGLKTQKLAKLHPDYSATTSLFRMNGTSMATAITSGVVALMLQVSPWLTPDQVKYRLMDTARLSITSSGEPVYNTFQQGLGRVWAPDAVLGKSDPAGAANLDMDIASDLAHGHATVKDLAYHYQGPVRRMTSDDGTSHLYYATESNGTTHALGVTRLDGKWMSADSVARLTWGGARMTWGGGLSWSGDAASFASARLTWGGARMTWGGTRMTWGGARMTWAGARMTWGGGLPWAGGQAWGTARMTWGGGTDAYGVARMTWGGSISGRASTSNTVWVGDDWVPPRSSFVPPPAATKP